MKKTYLLIFILVSSLVFSQNISEINSDIKLKDALNNQTEIRIYQNLGTTNYSSVLRMYKADKDWTVEFYEHYSKVEGITELKTEKRTLKSENDMQFVLLNLIRSNILNLPSLKEIRWKLVKRGNVELKKIKERNKIIEEYDLSNTETWIMDGESFKIQVSYWNQKNEFEFPNPDSYIKKFPEVDELVFMSEILQIVRDEFDIWKE
jgi:hypothetical protein